MPTFWFEKKKKCQVLMTGTSKCHLLKKKCICGCYQGPWWRDSCGLSRWTQNTVTSILVGEAEGDFPLTEEEEAMWPRRQRCSDVVTIQGMQATPETRRGKERTLPGVCHQRERGSVDSDFKSMTPILNFWFPELWGNKDFCFRPLNCW